MGFAIFLLNMPNKSGSFWVYIIPVLFFVGGLLVLINVFKRKLTISDTAITYANIFKTKSILFDQIKGCRIGEKVITIEPNQAGASKILINDYISLDDSDSIKDWVKTNFKDLDEADLTSSRNALLHDATLGYTEEDRKRKMTIAKTIAGVYNVLGMAAGFGMIFVRDAVIAAFVTIIYPLLAIAVIKWSYGLTKFLSSKKRSEYNFIMIGFFMPVCVMLFRSLSDYNLYHYDNLWLPFIGVGVLIGFVLVSIGLNTSIGGISGQIGFIVIVSAIYGFGVTVQTNCVFDHSQPKIFQTTVIEKYVHHGKSTSYYLVLNPWESGKETEKVEVGRSMYRDEIVGDTVHVFVKTGELNMPWYYIKR